MTVYVTLLTLANGDSIVSEPREKQASRKEALAMIWAAYRVSLPYILIFAGAMALFTWLITVVFL